jgi:hypothetical protein
MAMSHTPLYPWASLLRERRDPFEFQPFLFWFVVCGELVKAKLEVVMTMQIWEKT